jgi:hypothetical protein
MDFNDRHAAYAMTKGLEDAIRDKLRERILERIKPDIEMAIKGAMDSFSTALYAMRDPVHMRDVIKVILEDRRTK